MVRSFRVPNGTRFVPVKGTEKVEVTPLPIQDFLDEANEFVSIYGYGNIPEKDFRKEVSTIDSEVGDDEFRVSNNLAHIAFSAVMYSRMKMKVSWEDTSINSCYGNFAEDLITLPTNYSQTWLNYRKTGSGDLAFLDVPKLRLAIDIRPMRMDHSGTNDGKASMVGSRQQWIPRGSAFKGIYEVFSLFQDVNLGLHRDRKFPYLPPALGGYGKRLPFHQPSNFERFMKSFKQGTHSELIREIVYRTIDYISAKRSFQDPLPDPLLSHLVRFQSSFHNWVKGRSIYAPVTWVDIPPGLEAFQIAKSGTDPTLDEVINRLISERRLITEQQLQIAVEHNELCKSLLETRNVLESRMIREKARKEWTKLSIFSMESYGMIKELNLEKPNRLEAIGDIEILNFYKLVDSLRGGLRQTLRSETVYSREAMNTIYTNGPMHVRFTMQPKVSAYSRGFAAQSRDYRDVEDTELIGKLDSLYDWIVARKAGQDYPVPREIINDDNHIVAECNAQLYNIIVTDDIRLCRHATSKTGSVIFRVPCEWYYIHIYFGLQDWSSVISELAPGKEWKTHEDLGSLQSFEEKRFRDGSMLKQIQYSKYNVWKQPGEQDPEIYEEFDFLEEPQYNTDELLFDSRNILLRRRFQRRFKAAPKRSDNRNWRSI